MAPAGGERTGRWSTVAALGAAVLFLYVLDAFPLVALSLAVLVLALPPSRLHSAVFAAAIVLWALVLSPALSGFGMISRGWGLLLGGMFVLSVLLWPRASFFSRALVTVGTAMALTAIWLGITGAWSGLEGVLTQHFRSASLAVSGELAVRMPDSSWIEQFQQISERTAAWRAHLFPAVLALQSLAVLAIAWWGFVRLGTGGHRWPTLRPLREFRFNDQLVWVMIAGLVLVLLPLGPVADRIGANLLFFMAGLYALRGLAVFVFLAGRSPSPLSVVLGALAAVFLYHLVLTAALLVGLGDTWLDVRGRVALASSA